jgi:hypothetical protein
MAGAATALMAGVVAEGEGGGRLVVVEAAAVEAAVAVVVAVVAAVMAAVGTMTGPAAAAAAAAAAVADGRRAS